MVASTFADLKRHRAAPMSALRKEKFLPIGMEDEEVISSPLSYTWGGAYIGLIGHRCGQVPECERRNPHGYSVTRQEFEAAQQLGLPTLIFVMGDKPAGTKADFETDSEKIKKLDVFRERAKEGGIYVQCVEFG